MIQTEADIAAGLEALKIADDRLHAVIDRAGPVPLRRNPAGLRGLAGIIMAQQVSKASASAIFARFEAEVDFSDPTSLIDLGDEAFRRAGLSRAKQRTMLSIATAVIEGRLDFDRIAAASPDEAIGELVAVKGVGPWTAECYLLFCAGHPDIFPAGDLALQVAVGAAFGHAERPKEGVVAGIAEAWSPNRSVAARLFWAYYAALTRRDAAPAATAFQML